MTINRPYFMENKDWYCFDENDDICHCKLTDKAPKKAIDSYNEFYNEFVKAYGHLFKEQKKK